MNIKSLGGVRWFFAWGLVGLFVLAGCASLKPKPPEVSILSVRLLEMGFSEQKLGIVVRIHNPNDREFQLNQLDYQLELGGHPFARGALAREVVLPASGETVIEIPAQIRLASFLGSAVGKLLTGEGPAGRGELDYRLYGSARIDNVWSAPFEKAGRIELFKPADAKKGI